MSRKTEQYDVLYPTMQSLSISQCGLTICDKGHSSGTLLYDKYAAHFVVSGKGKYIVNGKTYDIHSGQGFMITPNIPNLYIADEENPWKYYYISFSGADSESLLHNAGLNDFDVTFNFELNDITEKLLKSIFDSSKNISSKGYDTMGYFLLLMNNLVSNNSTNTSVPLLPEYYLKRAVSYIEDNYPYEISVNTISSYLGIDRSHLYRLFIKHYKISPNEFLTNFRIEKSKVLLGYKRLSISDIAISTGFFDASHFIKVFKKKTGVSPGKYRFINYNF